jgi:hypothetical protein
MENEVKLYEKRVKEVIEEELANNLLPTLAKLDGPLCRALQTVITRLAADMENIHQTAGASGHN